MSTRSLRFSALGVAFDFEIDSRESTISESVATQGSWEENQLALYADLLGPGGVFIDIGANVGVNSLFAALQDASARIVAVEPSAENFAFLSRNLALNECRNVEARNVAVADYIGSIGFAGAGTNAHLQPQGGSTDQVPCLTLDQLVRDVGAQVVNLMKIDVEGYTDLVLSCSAYAKTVVKAMIVEFSRGDIEARIRSSEMHFQDHVSSLFQSLAEGYRYSYYISRNDGLIRIDDARDAFDLMALESPVGDILFTKTPMPSFKTALNFACSKIKVLLDQNHLRILDVQALNAKVVAH